MTTTDPSPAVWLGYATQQYTDGDSVHATAAATTGLLAALVETMGEHKLSDELQAQLDAADEKLGRLADLADWHETKAMKARNYPGGPERLDEMRKAAEVHDDAARRIRAALDPDTPDTGGADE